MTVAQTSLDAYREHRASGMIGKQAQQILDALKMGETLSRRELMLATGLEISSVCGRVNELLSIGMLEELSPRRCSITGKRVSPVRKPLTLP